MLLDIIITISLVLLNAFFVAAEFAIVKVRYSQIQIKADQGNKVAKTSQHIIKHLDTYLSATQLGITLASLGLGWVGEPIVANIISKTLLLFNLTLTPETLHAISLPTAFVLITMLHIIFGELAPKSIAIRKPESTTLMIAYPLMFFYKIFQPFIWLMNAISNAFLKMIGIHPAGEHDIHSTDELQLLVRQSKEGGALEDENYEIIKNAFDFTDHTVKQIMVPRQQIFGLDIDLPKNEIIDKILEYGYSRIPVYQDSVDNIIGIAYAKDVLKGHYQNPDFNLKDLLHQTFYVIETKRISDILAEFQKRHLHIAIVIDEFGGTEGLITLEDILEELVGEIQDEDDDERPVVEKKDEKTFIIQSTTSLEDINDHLPYHFTISENYNTLSGLMLYNFNRIPKLNDKITLEGYELTVTKIQHRTIQVVQAVYLESKSTVDNEPQE
ncbi:MAG: HlyC/CorC family transporter [Bacteroidales bacterium]|nr:MAG: HlyC/CorC family transporter [Bacteroidales bacterium]